MLGKLIALAVGAGYLNSFFFSPIFSLFCLLLITFSVHSSTCVKKSLNIHCYDAKYKEGGGVGMILKTDKSRIPLLVPPNGKLNRVSRLYIVFLPFHSAL